MPPESQEEICKQNCSQTNDNLNAFKVLDEHSMCRRYKVNRKYMISVHRLVQQVTRAKLDEEGKLTEMIANLIQCIDDDFDDDELALNQMIHIQTLLDHAINNNVQLIGNKTQYFTLLEKINTKYRERQRYREAYEFNCYAIHQLESIFGKYSQEVMRMMYYQASNLETAGDYKEALEILENVLEYQNELFDTSPHDPNENDTSPEKANQEVQIHCDILKTRLLVGVIYMKQEKLTESQEMLEEELKIHEASLGQSHTEIVSVKLHIGNVFHCQGKYTEALQILKHVHEIQIQQTHFGEEMDKLVLPTKLGIANVYQSQGNYQLSLNLYREILKVQEKVWGKENPDALTTKHNIAQNLYLSEPEMKRKEALIIFKEVLKTRVRVLGNDHTDTLKTKTSIAEIYKMEFNYEASLELFDEILKVQGPLLGNKHPAILTTKQNIGELYKNLGRYGDAIKVFEELIEIRKRLLIFDKEIGGNLTLVHLKYNLGDVFKMEGIYHKALNLFQQVLQTLSVNHPVAVITKRNIADVYERLGNYEACLKYLKQVLTLTEEENQETESIKLHIKYLCELDEFKGN